MRTLLLAASSLLVLTSIASAACTMGCCKNTTKACPMACCSVPEAKNMTPTTFAQTIAMVDLTEIKLGGVAQANSASPAVKKFAAYMVKSHTQINGWLTTVAAGEKITLPTTLNQKNAAIVAKLSTLKGQTFDTTYIPAMVNGHTKVLAMIKNFEATTTDPVLKKFAQKIEPIIAKHLKDATKVQTKLQKAGELPAPAAQ